MKKVQLKAPTGGVSSSHWVFDVLRMVIDSPEPVGVSDISQKLGIPPTTAQRGLLTLEHAGYIQPFGARGKFLVGDQPRRLLQGFFGRFPLRSFIMPYVTQFSLTIHETVVLWIPIGWNAVAIGTSEGLGDVFTRVPRGEVRPFRSSATGDIFLSYRGEEDLAAFETYDRKQNGADDQLHRRIRSTLRRGYTLQQQEHNASLAFPIRFADAAIGCVSVEGSCNSLVAREKDLVRIIQPTLMDIEKIMARKPDLCANPYDYISPQIINLQR